MNPSNSTRFQYSDAETLLSHFKSIVELSCRLASIFSYLAWFASLLLLASCLDFGTGKTSSQGSIAVSHAAANDDGSNQDYADSNVTNPFGKAKFLAFSGNAIALVNAETGKFEWKKELSEKPCPFQIHTLINDRDLAIITWVDEFASPGIALVDKTLDVKLCERDAVVAAGCGNRLLVEVLSHLGAERFSLFTTVVWNTSKCKAEDQFKNIGVLASCIRLPANQVSMAGTEAGRNAATSQYQRIKDSTAVMSGPATEGDIDIYGNTILERVVKYDIKTGKTVFESVVEKEYGSAFELVADLPNRTLLTYSTAGGSDILVALNARGMQLWSYNVVGQIYRVPLYPYAWAVTELAIALDGKGESLACFVVHENSSPEIQIISTKTGEIKLKKSIMFCDGFVTSLEFVDKGILANVSLGKSAVLVGWNGDVWDATPTETPPVYAPAVREPELWVDVATGTEIEVANDIVTVRKMDKPESSFRIFDPTARTAKIAGVYGNPARYLLLRYSNPGLAQDLASTNRLALLDFAEGKWIVGDELSDSAFKYYGSSDLVVTDNAIYRFSESGEIIKSTAFPQR